MVTLEGRRHADASCARPLRVRACSARRRGDGLARRRSSSTARSCSRRTVYEGSATVRPLDHDEAVALERADGFVVQAAELLRASARRDGEPPPAAAGTSPRTAPACARGSSRVPRDGQLDASGHASQRGMRARQIVAPRSMSACAAADENDAPVRRTTRATFTSTGSTSSSNAKRRIAAAVYVPTPGSSVRSSGQPLARRSAWPHGGG